MRRIKNFIISPRSIYGLFVVLGVGLLASCDENIHDFAKKTGSDAAHAVYIADSVFMFPVFTGVNGENLGVDTIVAKFPIHLSKAATEDVKVSVIVDSELVSVYNARHGKNYNKFPDSKLIRSTVTIGKGQTESEDSVVVSFPKSPANLVNTNGYLLPVKIYSYGGTDVKIDYEGRVAYLVVNVTPQQNGVYFKLLENSAKITNNPNLGIFNDLGKMNFTLYSISETNNDVKVSLSVNNSLIAEYNKLSGTDYQAISETDFGQVEVIIQGGATKVTDVIPYRGNVSTLKDMRGYVVPLEIKSVTGTEVGIVNAQKVFYAIIDMSNLYCESVENDVDLGTKITDRTGYTVVRFADDSGTEITPSNGNTKNNMFTNNNAEFWAVQKSGIKLNITVDLGAEVRNITGLFLEGYQANASFNMKAVDVLYATSQMYEKGQDALVGKISLSTGKQTWYIKFSEPVNARYIKLNNMIPTGSMLALRQFYIYTDN